MKTASLFEKLKYQVSINKSKFDDNFYATGCLNCPLGNKLGIKHIEPHGSETPDIYILGEAPGEQENKQGLNFVGPAGQTLHLRIPKELVDYIRFNNIIRTYPGKNQSPPPEAINFCRNSVIKDIEKTKPKAIFAFGNYPLTWLIKESGITKWNGKRAPVRIGNHTCWAYFHMHPSYVLRSRREGFVPKDETQYGSDIEFAFAKDLERAFEDVFNDNLEKPFIHTKEHALKNVRCISGESQSDLDDIISFLDECNNDNFVGLDYETNALRPYTKDAKILTVAIAKRESTLAFAIHHREAQWNEKQLNKLEYHFRKFLMESKCKKIAHHLVFELEWSAYFYGTNCVHTEKWEDTIVQAWVLDERRGTHSLDFLCKQYFGLALKDISFINRGKIDEYPLDQILLYNGLDAKYGRKLFFSQRKEIDKQGLKDAYKHMLSRVPTIVLTQIDGIPVDQEIVQQFNKQYSKELKKIEDKIAELPLAQRFKKLKEKDYRPSAPYDTKFVLNNILKRDLENTTESTLVKIKEPLIQQTLKWRKINKQLSTYVKPLMEGSPDLYPDGLLHPQIKTIDTRTGRTSSDNPNIQNFPKRQTQDVRSQIRVNSNLVIVAFDFAGIQARNVAQESKDKKLVDAFWNGYDVHGEWCEIITKHYPQWIEGGGKALARDKELFKKHRHLAKNLFVFPTFFGASPKSISANLRIPLNIMTDVQNEFWDEFPDIKRWHKRLKRDYEKYGYVTGLSGLRRRAPIGYNELINCVDTETECLTESGWKNVNELQLGMKIYTKNPKTGIIELCELQKINKGKYKGKVHVMNGAISSITTPNHRWLVDGMIDHGEQNGGVEFYNKFVESKELPMYSTRKNRIHLTGIKVNQKANIWTDDEVELIGWLLTDGSYESKLLKKTRKIRRKIIIMQSPRGNPEKVEKIDALFNRLAKNPENSKSPYRDFPIKPFSRYYYGGSKCVHWIMSNYLSNKIYESLPERNATPEFISQLSTEQLKILFDTMLLGDGTWNKKEQEIKSFTTGTKAGCDIFSMLCVLLGIPHTITCRKAQKNKKKYKSMGNKVTTTKPYWVIHIKRRHRAHPGFYSHWEEFNGIMWCPTTKNGTFIARRNGHIYVTGNSSIQANESFIVMNAMIRLSKIGMQAVWEIHDDLGFIWDKRKVEKNTEIVVKEMLRISPDWLGIVPLEIEQSIGSDWASLKEVAKFSSTQFGHKRNVLVD